MPLCFTRPIQYVVDRLHTAPAPPRRHYPEGLYLGTYNIRNGRFFSLAQSIWGVRLSIFDGMLLTDTNITSEAYFHNWLGYDMVCFPAISKTTGGVQGVVGLVVRERPQGWSLDLTRLHRPNLVSCKVISGVKRTPLVGAYLPPSIL